MSGPQKTPTAIAMVRGNPGGRPLNTSEPQPPADGQPSPPKLDDDEREVWDRLAPLLYGMGVLTDVDVDDLARYCRAHIRYLDAMEIVKEDGSVVNGANGGQILSPQIHVMEKAANEMHKIGQGFGMSPAARTKISVSPPDDKKPNRFDGQQRA